MNEPKKSHDLFKFRKTSSSNVILLQQHINDVNHCVAFTRCFLRLLSQRTCLTVRQTKPHI